MQVYGGKDALASKAAILSRGAMAWVALLLLWPVCTHGEKIVVGSSKGWTLSVKYDTLQARPGDTLVSKARWPAAMAPAAMAPAEINKNAPAMNGQCAAPFKPHL
jgi:hypothetical protein